MIDEIRDEEREEEERRARRAERMAQMRIEKERWERRNRLARKLFPYGVAALAIIIIVIIGGAVFGGKPKGEADLQAQTTEQTTNQTDGQTTGQPTNQADGQSIAQTDGQLADGQTLPQADVPPSNQPSTGQIDNSIIQPDNSIGQESAGGITTDTNGEPEGEVTIEDEKKATATYSFAETEDTVTIYNEEIISSNIILIDESTDTIVAAKGATERISPASMTKVLTVLVAAEQLTEADLDDTFMMTLEITDYAYINDCSSVGFLNEEVVTVRDLLYGTILPSGGDAAVGLATYVAGSHEAFVEMMNDKLAELGLSESANFTNCVGLYDEEHYCTVYDMAVIMKAAIQNELCREVLSARTYTTSPTTEHPEGIQISNWFLRRIEDKDTGGEVLCAKTGFVAQSKSCAVSYGVFADDTPYICVTTGSDSSWKCIYDHVKIYNQYVPAE